MGRVAMGGAAHLASAISDFNTSNLEAYDKLYAPDLQSLTGVGGALRIDGRDARVAWIKGAKQLFLSSTSEPHDLVCRSYNDDVVIANGYFVFRP